MNTYYSVTFQSYTGKKVFKHVNNYCDGEFFDEYVTHIISCADSQEVADTIKLIIEKFPESVDSIKIRQQKW